MRSRQFFRTLVWAFASVSLATSASADDLLFRYDGDAMPAAAGWESGNVRVERTGVVTLITGSSAHGQGHETTWAQIVADALGVRPEDVTVRHGDTGGENKGTDRRN